MSGYCSKSDLFQLNPEQKFIVMTPHIPMKTRSFETLKIKSMKDLLSSAQ